MVFFRKTFGIFAIAAMSSSVILVNVTGALAETPRELNVSPCGEGFEKIEHLTIAKEDTYECRRILNCEAGYTAIMHEVFEEDGKIIQRYTCSRPNQGLIIYMDDVEDGVREEVSKELPGTDDE